MFTGNYKEGQLIGDVEDERRQKVTLATGIKIACRSNCVESNLFDCESQLLAVPALTCCPGNA